jgi:flagellar hook-associated protein 1 FlgK
MSGLFGSLSIAMRSLIAQQAAMQVTSQNIANVNTPGYTREIPNLVENPPVQYGSILFGNGVDLQGINSVRDSILNLRIYQENGQQGQLQSFTNQAQQVQSLFSVSGGSGMQTALNNFFASLTQLASNPSDMPSRQSVIGNAQTLAAAFQSTASQLTQIQHAADLGVGQSVTQINQLTTQIAQLNTQVSSAVASGQNAGPIQDQRDQLINQLSGLVDLSVIDAGNGSVTLTTQSGTTLVSGNIANALTAAPDPTTGFTQVLAQGVNITSSIQGGQLGGLIQARDQFVPSVQSNVDNLAAGIISSFNTQHQAGFDLNGNPGGNFFVPFVQPSPGSNAGAAASFSVAITDPTLIAASADGTSGNNVNIQALANLQNQPLISNQTPVAFFAGTVSQVGNQVSSATSELDAANLSLTQLLNQQSSESGVSLDEESTNLIKYQRAYEAAARVVSVIDSLTQTALNMVQP